MRRPNPFEAAIAVICTAAVAVSVWALPGIGGLLGAGLALLMVAIAAVDYRKFIIPNELNAAALILGIVNAAAADTTFASWSASLALLRGAITMAVFLAMRVLYRRLRGREGLGLGDIKLAGVAGVWLDWMLIPVAVEIAALAALVSLVVAKLISRKPMHAASRIPFGLFLGPAIWLTWLFGAAMLGLR
jgi:leader peptidase (prepilin peptidase) / N-methyltransferase